jgi:hypothetical protein
MECCRPCGSEGNREGGEGGGGPISLHISLQTPQPVRALQSLSSALAQNSGAQRPLARAGSSATLYNPMTRTPSNLWSSQQLQSQVNTLLPAHPCHK